LPDIQIYLPQPFQFGAGKVNTTKYFAGKVSLWLFHGAIDDVVPVDFSRNYFKQLRKLKADVRYTEFPNTLHNSWINALHEPGLMSWLFSKEKKQIF
jgi:predicted peptidase